MFSAYALFVILSFRASAQDTVKVVTWNLLNIYPSSTDRVPHYRTVTDSLLPDIIAVQ
jgi:hypothetical protein